MSAPDRSWTLRDGVLALAVLATLAAAAAGKALDPIAFKRLLHDGGPVESAQALLFALAALFAFLAARALRPRALDAALFGGLAALLLFVAGEEVAWGQQAFGFATPEWLRPHNRQRELTLHNLHAIQPGLRWVMLLLTGYAVASRPAVIAWERLRGAAPDPTSRRRLCTPTASEALCFVPPLLWTAVVHLQLTLTLRWGWTWAFIGVDPSKRLLVWKDQEVIELLIALGFAAFALRRWQLVRPSPQQRERPAGASV